MLSSSGDRRPTDIRGQQAPSRCRSSVPAPTVVGVTDASGDANRWQPLSIRESGAKPDGPYEGVPSHLFEPLHDWAVDVSRQGNLRQRVKLRLRLYEDLLPGDDQLLDYVDALLHFFAETLPRLKSDAGTGETMRWRMGLLDALASVRAPGQMLSDAGSVWTTRVENTGTSIDIGLQRRQSAAELRARDDALAAAAASPQPNAADDLAVAHRAIFGRHPSPSQAYGLAVRAVEHALVPVTAPNNRKATLGTVLGELRGNQKDKWQFDPGTGHPGQLATPVDLLEILWKGQDDRHGGQPGYAEAPSPRPRPPSGSPSPWCTGSPPAHSPPLPPPAQDRGRARPRICRRFRRWHGRAAPAAGARWP